MPPAQSALPFREIESLGQIFTPSRWSGRCCRCAATVAGCSSHPVETAPFAASGWRAGRGGDRVRSGALSRGGAQHGFFAYPVSQRFDTIIGNPPYVRFQDISPSTRALLAAEHFDGRSNLYLFFIEKCLRHLAPGGELIFITPRDFLKATSALQLNRLLWSGPITDAIELGDARVFDGALPNCLIWRFEKVPRCGGCAMPELGQGMISPPCWHTIRRGRRAACSSAKAT